MLDAFSKRLLNRKPRIQRIVPRSTDTILDLSPNSTGSVAEQRVETLIKAFENVAVAAEQVEKKLVARASSVTLELDFTNPEDFSAGQAAARLFPDKAVEIQPGISVVTTLDMDMFNHCIQDMKAHGLSIGQQNQLTAATPNPKRTSFGGNGTDRRPELNAMTSIVPPVDIPAFVIAAIPLLFAMLSPLISAQTTVKIVEHTHNIITPEPTKPTGPGLPLIP